MKTKQVIVIRKDLGMRRGKEIAQGSHASMAFLTKRLTVSDDQWDGKSIYLSEEERHWMNHSFAKITLQVETEEELMELHSKAIESGLESHVVVDNGKTEFNGEKTVTALAIGPDQSNKIDSVTSHLKLY